MGYRRLAQEDRYQIQAFLASGSSLRQAARHMGVVPSTISREVKKCREYDPIKAQQITKDRRAGRYERLRKIHGDLEAHVREKLEQKWSPEQVAGRLRRDGAVQFLSHQTIYRYINRDKAMGGKLWKQLRILRKERKDRKLPDWKPLPYLPFRKHIKDRPKVVEERKRLGDYERDLLLGKMNGHLFLTLVDRTSRLLKLEWLPKKNAEFVHEATVRALREEPLHTITNDNGSEFAQAQRTEKALNVPIYFNRAYRAWERGTNENTNGLLRQYFPRKTQIPRLKAEDVKWIEYQLNTRPRKCLGYRTPLEVHNQLKSLGVALET